jgi:hypothetical protein
VQQTRNERSRTFMADLLFIVVTIAAFAVLILFAYACDRA